MLKGAYAFGLIIDDNPDEIYCARAGSPLALGIGPNGDEHFLGSDAMAMAQLTDQLIYLEEGDWAIIRPDGYKIFDETDKAVTREITTIKGGPTLSENIRITCSKKFMSNPTSSARHWCNILMDI